jgi:hypothetical protein
VRGFICDRARTRRLQTNEARRKRKEEEGSPDRRRREALFVRRWTRSREISSILEVAWRRGRRRRPNWKAACVARCQRQVRRGSVSGARCSNRVQEWGQASARACAYMRGTSRWDE